MTDAMRKSYRELTEEEKAQVTAVKDKGAEFIAIIDDIKNSGNGPSRELSLAVTKIEEAVMWAVKHVTA